MELTKNISQTTIIKSLFAIILGSIALTISAKIKIPFYPVPMTMLQVEMGLALIFHEQLSFYFLLKHWWSLFFLTTNKLRPLYKSYCALIIFK